MTSLRFLNGAAAELFVASFFADRGYNILWPLLTQSRYDIVLEKDGKFDRVQVKKATWSKAGKFSYLQTRISGKNKQSNRPYKEGDVDTFAFSDMKDIWVVPASEIIGKTSICLGSDNPKYKIQAKYDPIKWKQTH